MASGSLPSFTVLTEEDDVRGSKFEREPEEYTVGQLKRWLKCRRLKLSGKRDELLKRVSDCIKSGNHHTLDPSIDDGKWFSAKVLKENAKLQANCSLSSLPFVPSTGWCAFPSQNIPSLFNYGHVHYYTLESVQDINGAEEIEDGLGHMTDKPLKNGRKYVDSGFVHDIMDTVNGKRHFVRAHVNLAVDENRASAQCYCCDICEQGAVIHASCEPCRASSLGRCSHVVAVLFSVLDYVKKHGPVLAKPCTSEECS